MSKTSRESGRTLKTSGVATESSVVPTLTSDMPSVVIKVLLKAAEDLKSLAKKQDQEFCIKVEHCGELLGQTEAILPSTEQTDIDFEVNVCITPSVPTNVNNVISNPVIFNVVDGSFLSEKEKESIKKVPKEPAPVVSLGRCNLDILPVVLGEMEMSKSLIIEQDEISRNENMKTWLNLPKILVVVSVASSLETLECLNGGNILHFTVESVYNLDVSRINDKMSFNSATIMPITSEVYQDIIFNNGLLKDVPPLETRKCWAPSSSIPGKCYSNYRMSTDTLSIKVDPQINLNENHDEHIEWNSMRRCVMVQSAVRSFFSKLRQYRCWPIEVYFGMKSPEEGGHKTKETAPPMHMFATLDITDLLFPGVTKVRTACQLFSYNLEDLKGKFKVEKSIFGTEPRLSVYKKSDTKSMRTLTQTESALTVAPGAPQFSGEGLPTYIIVEVELLTPLIPKRSPEILYKSISEIIPKRPEVPKQVVSAQMAEKHFKQAINEATEKITKQYNDNYTDYIGKNDDCFFTHILQTGLYKTLKEMLSDKISLMCREKYVSIESLESKLQKQQYISYVYKNLVEEMHTIVNDMVEIEEPDKDFKFETDSIKQYYYSMEALEEAKFDRAKTHLLERIEKSNLNPNYWIEYAFYWLRMKEKDKALECVKEALQLDIRHPLGLLMYGAMTSLSENPCHGDLFLDAITTFYPYIPEFWIARHLHYIRLRNYEGVNTTLKMAYKVYKQCKELTYDCITCDSIVWSQIDSEEESVFLRAARLFMKLNLFEFTEMVLAQELDKNGKTIPYIYYLSVCLYLQEKYEEAVSYLEPCVKIEVQNYKLLSIFGHCHYKLDNLENAECLYKTVCELKERKEDIHLVRIRLGWIYLKSERYDLAKQVLSDACFHCPSPITWLGVGIANYKMDDFFEALKCLEEANALDNLCPITWGYLAIVNLELHEQRHFEQCFKQAIKLHLQDSELLEKIQFTQMKLQNESIIVVCCSGGESNKETLDDNDL